jgi:general secretion pathway protein D
LSTAHRSAEPARRVRRARTASALFTLAVATLLGSGCAVATANRAGRAAEDRQDYDSAVVEYTKALRLEPGNADARTGLDRAKIRAAIDHFNRGRRLAATGKYDQALVEYELAAELNPTSSEIDEQLRVTRNQLRAKVAIAREGKTELEALVERARDQAPTGLDLPQDVRMPASLIFRDASSRDAFLVIARFGNISLAFDPAFREAPVTVDLRNTTLEQALGQVADATRAFFRVTTPGSVLVIPDTPAKRREYEEEVVRIFYLSNADLKETMDLMRVVLDARRISAITGTNALSIKDTPERIAAAARVISAIDKARPEVIIDVELLEVDRTKLLEYGLQIASPGQPGISGSVGVPADGSQTLTLQALRNLTQADVLLAGLPALYYRLLKSDANTRTLANPQLRTTEGIAAQARFGERIPIPNTTFVPIATGGTPQQPIISYQYENIGVNLDITPRTHHDDEVTLALRVNVQSIAGTGYNNLPTFGNRDINTVIRLRDGETNLLAGLIRDEERRLVEGIPGLSDLPFVGKLFAHSKNEVTQTDIILTLTPHIVRVLDLTESDLRVFRVGRDSLAPISDIPLPIDLPRPADAPAAPAPTPAPAPPPAGTLPPPGTPIPPPGIPPGTPIPPPTPRLPGQ